MDYVVKKWNHALNCWVLDSSVVSNEGKYWDAKTGAWVVDPACTKDDKPSLTRQIANIGEQKMLETSKKKIEEIPTPKTLEKTTGKTSYSYPTKPWEGVDAKRFPSTFMTLVKLYHLHEWYRVGPWVSDDEYKDRLKGIYREKAKSTQMVPRYHSVYNDWEY